MTLASPVRKAPPHSRSPAPPRRAAVASSRRRTRQIHALRDDKSTSSIVFRKQSILQRDSSLKLSEPQRRAIPVNTALTALGLCTLAGLKRVGYPPGVRLLLR